MTREVEAVSGAATGGSDEGGEGAKELHCRLLQEVLLEAEVSEEHLAYFRKNVAVFIPRCLLRLYGSHRF